MNSAIINLGFAAPTDAVAVPAVGVQQVIIAAQGDGGADCRAFLTDGQVHGAVNAAQGVELLRLVFEGANHQHFQQHVEGAFRAQFNQERRGGCFTR